MSEFLLARERINPDMMVYGLKRLPINPQFANFTFTPKGIRLVDHRIQGGRARFVRECLTRNVHPTGRFTYSNSSGGGFNLSQEVDPPAPTETRKAEIMRLELDGHWDPAKIIVRLPKTASTAQAFRQFRDGFMDQVAGMGQRGYELTAAEICIVSLAGPRGSFEIETGVMYQVDVHSPFLKLVISERTRNHNVAQKCVRPLQSWFDDLKVNPVLPHGSS